MGVLLRRQQLGKNYTIFSNSTAAIERLRTDRPGPGQALAQTIRWLEGVSANECTLTIRWTPALKGVEGNEMRKSTEARSQQAREWIRHVKAECRCRSPKGGRIRGGLQRENNGEASCYFQLLSEHAAIGPYLTETTPEGHKDR